ncbi:MAG TPA: helix-turn-helix domain-containing protein [Candidatus Krumholzibacteria bacterium]|nr:helix-turn-helix domain-containing protein [Candidatus Krumholzibacteria bacterium]HRX51069.1 helix-turn-helix domain-containing protein [Candidatus Krumholzibacteria bacterium]
MTASKTASTPCDGLVRLCHHRWLVPMIAQIGRLGGERVASLTGALGASAPSVRRTLAAARELDLVMTNPGYGHPLRPEILLTPWGEAVARECAGVVDAARDLDHANLASRKWSLPVLAALVGQRLRFSDLALRLPDATPRSLALALRALVEAGLVERAADAETLARPEYGLAPAAEALARRAAALAAAAEFLGGGRRSTEDP